jgi:hypothetical protein
MPDKSWKQVERRLAAIFGTCRRSLSGGNSKTGRDDCMHATLFLEAKHRAKLPFGTLYRQTLAMAQKEEKVPVLGYQEKGKHGIFIVFNSIHFLDVCKAWAEANGYRLIKVRSKQ